MSSHVIRRTVTGSWVFAAMAAAVLAGGVMVDFGSARAAGPTSQSAASSANAGLTAGGSQWFDATTGQLSDLGRPIADVNTATWARAGRAANEFCRDRGFVGGFLNGHQLANRRGVICLR